MKLSRFADMLPGDAIVQRGATYVCIFRSVHVPCVDVRTFCYFEVAYGRDCIDDSCTSVGTYMAVLHDVTPPGALLKHPKW